MYLSSFVVLKKNLLII